MRDPNYEFKVEKDGEIWNIFLLWDGEMRKIMSLCYEH